VENSVGEMEENGAKVLEVDWPDNYNKAGEDNRICRRRRCCWWERIIQLVRKIGTS
jgi:hypothetical protein